MAWLESLGVGAGLGLSLAAPPGPVLAKVAFETTRGRWRQGLLVGLGATSADALYFSLIYLGLFTILPGPRVLGALALAGVALMDLFAYEAWRAARRPVEVASRRALSGWSGGFVLAVTSPFNLAWWLTSGASFVALYGLPLAAGFFPAILAWVVLSVALFAYGSARIARFESYVAYASAGLLWAFGVFLAYRAVGFLVG